MRVSFIAFFISWLSVVSASLSGSDLSALINKQSKNYIQITSKNYDKILSGPRDYHLVLLLTSSASQINCVLCNEFKPEFQIVADSYVKDHPYNNDASGEQIFFAISEFTESKDLFQQLQLKNIPKVYHFAPTNEPVTFTQGFTEYQFFSGDHKANVLNWIFEQTGKRFNIHEPVNYSSIISTAVLTIFSILTARKLLPYINSVLSSKQLWSGVSLISILLFTSGYMFNSIRGTQYIRAHQDGNVEYFIPGHQQQLGVETQIISFVYGALSIFIIILIKKVPEFKNSQVKFLTVSIFSSLVFIFFSLLICIFHKKSYGYPYKLLNIF